MSKRKNTAHNLQKLSAFFSPVTARPGQNGVDLLQTPSETEDSTALNASGRRDAAPAQHTPDTPSSRSPVKSRPRLQGPSAGIPLQTDSMEMSETPPLFSQIPDSDQPLTLITMKDMLLSLHSALTKTITTNSSELQVAIQHMGDRVGHIENKMSDYVGAYNDLLEAHTELKSEVQHIRDKLTDIEDRSRRNNLRFRGIPESVTTDILKDYLMRLFRAILPGVADQELLIDRAHRLPKPKHIPLSLPRDVIIRVHFYHTKEAILYAARNNPLPDPYTKLQIFADLSQATMAARRAFLPLTTSLRAASIPYKWGFPTKLVVKYSNSTFVISDTEHGYKLLKQWNCPLQSTRQDTRTREKPLTSPPPHSHINQGASTSKPTNWDLPSPST